MRNDAQMTAVIVPEPQRKALPESYTLEYPRIYTFLVIFSGLIAVSTWLYCAGGGFINWYAGIVWCVPIGMTLIGLAGALRTRRAIRRLVSEQSYIGRIDESLIVTIPTIGRFNTLPALLHVVKTFATYLPKYFNYYRIDVVVEEGAEAIDHLCRIQSTIAGMRLVVVPREYETPNQTRFKARANHYALELRRNDGETSSSTSILHMDDDTAADDDTVREVARFIRANPWGRRAKHLAQGVLTYDRSRSPNRWTWLADSIRASDDTTRFAALTGGGLPRAGLHGEMLLVRAIVEDEIGWDFGPDEIVEDSRFALEFARRYPHKSAWIAARCYGASPATIKDFIMQRRRWAEGIIRLSFNRQLPLRQLLVIMYGSIWWTFGLLQHAVPMVLAGWALGQMNISPMFGPLVLVWSLNMAYVVWSHWEGLRLNAHASGMQRASVGDRLLVIPLVYLFSLWEGLAGLWGAVRYVLRREARFVVIRKPC